MIVCITKITISFSAFSVRASAAAFKFARRVLTSLRAPVMELQIPDSSLAVEGLLAGFSAGDSVEPGVAGELGAG